MVIFSPQLTTGALCKKKLVIKIHTNVTNRLSDYEIGVQLQLYSMSASSVRWPTANIIVVLLGWELLNAIGTSPTPHPQNTTSTIHTWPAKTTSQWQSQLTSHPTPQHTADIGNQRGEEGSWFIWHITEHQDKLAAACSLRADYSCNIETVTTNHSQEVKKKHMLGQSHLIFSEMFLFVEMFDKKKKCDPMRQVGLGV